jgi:hypothetical protein
MKRRAARRVIYQRMMNLPWYVLRGGRIIVRLTERAIGRKKA